MCNTNDSSLVIDSAIAYPSGIGFKVLLFSGDVLYESESVDRSENRMNFTSKPIKEFSSPLEPTIDIATIYKTANEGIPNTLLFVNVCVHNIVYWICINKTNRTFK